MFLFLLDVIGQIVEVAQMEIVSVNGKDTQKISIELRNEEYDFYTFIVNTSIFYI